nr:VOC family protein [Oleiagrimonas soli]
MFYNGQCEEAFRFYADCTGGELLAVMPYADAPPDDAGDPAWKDKIMHACLRIGDSLLMASDAPPGRQSPMGGFSVSLQIDDPAEAERCFEALSAGGEVRMPIGETFWAQRFGMFVDRFGVPWMINCTKSM